MKIVVKYACEYTSYILYRSLVGACAVIRNTRSWCASPRPHYKNPHSVFSFLLSAIFNFKLSLSKHRANSYPIRNHPISSKELPFFTESKVRTLFFILSCSFYTFWRISMIFEYFRILRFFFTVLYEKCMNFFV